MPSDLSEPRRLHPISPVFGLLFHARELIPALLAIAVSGVFVLVPVGLAVFVVARYVSWWRTTWSFDGQVFRLDGGVIGRRQKRVPAARVQQVELIRKLHHQVLGLASLRVETAGASRGSEIELEAVDLATAEALRAKLLAARDHARETEGPSPSSGVADAAPSREARTHETASHEDPSRSGDGRPCENEDVVRLSAGRLALAGMTGAQLLVLAPALGWAMQLVDDVPERFRPGRGSRVPALDEMAGETLVALVLVGLTVWIGLAAATSVVTNFGLTVRRQGDDLVLRRGLFQRRESVVPLHRIQALRIEQSLLRRALGMAALRVQSGGSAGDADHDRVALPLVTPAEVGRVLEVVFGAALATGPLTPAPRAARARALTRCGLGAAVPAVALSALLAPWGLLPGFVVAWAGLLLGADSFRSLGYRLDVGARGTVLITRTGSLMRRTVVVPARRAQSTRVAATVMQRRRGLATLAIDVAGRGRAPTVVDQNVVVTEALAMSLLGANRAAPTGGGPVSAGPVYSGISMKMHSPGHSSADSMTASS